MIQQFVSEGSPIYLTKLGMMFSRTKSFCFENDVFLTFGLGLREGVGVDIQVGSCIFLNAFLLNHCMCT